MGRKADIKTYERETRNGRDRKSTRLNSSHLVISYAVFCLKKKTDHVARQLGAGDAARGVLQLQRAAVAIGLGHTHRLALECGEGIARMRPSPLPGGHTAPR